jgi:hypothetical protein
MDTAIPEWKLFERAVAAFIAAIAPDAKVTHDVEIPDAHTGHPRQRDVWVEWAIGGHFPAKALISCKFWSSKLNEQDIDHFNGEFLSSRANVGVIYSKSGFNDFALEKAEKLNFHCCKLYSNAPAELPRQIVLGLAYHFAPQISLEIKGELPNTKFSNWGDVFRIPFGEGTVQDAIESHIIKYHDSNAIQERWRHATAGLAYSISLVIADWKPVSIFIGLRDRVRRARTEYSLLNGSYNFTFGLFTGESATPFIDTQSSDPGPGWEEINTLPETMPVPVVACFMQADPKSAVDSFSRIPIPVEQLVPNNPMDRSGGSTAS